MSVCVGRITLDALFSEPLHDTYSIFVGLHILLAFKLIGKTSLGFFRRFQRHTTIVVIPSSASIGLVARRRLVTIGNLVLLAVHAVLLPLLLGVAFHLFILHRFVDADRAYSKISLSTSFAYGTLLSLIAIAVAPRLPGTRLALLLNRVRRYP